MEYKLAMCSSRNHDNLAKVKSSNKTGNRIPQKIHLRVLPSLQDPLTKGEFYVDFAHVPVNTRMILSGPVGIGFSCYLLGN